MNKKAKAKWLKALRSGRYKQTTQCLYDGKGHCCLGVLCRTQRLRPINQSGTYVFSFQKEAGYSYLPNTLAKKLDISLRQQKHLSKLNDDEYQSFREIADYIQKHL